jgi:hypothetical protein
MQQRTRSSARCQNSEPALILVSQMSMAGCLRERNRSEIYTLVGRGVLLSYPLREGFEGLVHSFDRVRGEPTYYLLGRTGRDFGRMVRRRGRSRAFRSSCRRNMTSCACISLRGGGVRPGNGGIQVLTSMRAVWPASGARIVAPA